MAPSKATGRGQHRSPGELQQVAYTGRVWLSATQTGSQTGVQVGQLAVFRGLNNFFGGKIGLFPLILLGT